MTSERDPWHGYIDSLPRPKRLLNIAMFILGGWFIALVLVVGDKWEEIIWRRDSTDAR